MPVWKCELILLCLALCAASCRPSSPEASAIDEWSAKVESNARAVAAKEAAPDSNARLYLARAYEDFAKKNPKDPKTPAYLFEAAGLYDAGLGDARKAASLYRRLQSGYGKSTFASAAMLELGRLYMTSLNEPKNAELIFSAFLNQYPTHPEAETARQALVFLTQPVDSLYKHMPKQTAPPQAP